MHPWNLSAKNSWSEWLRLCQNAFEMVEET